MPVEVVFGTMLSVRSPRSSKLLSSTQRSYQIRSPVHSRCGTCKFCATLSLMACATWRVCLLHALELLSGHGDLIFCLCLL